MHWQADFNTIVLFIIAVMNLVSGYLTWVTHQNMQSVKVATDGMKDALVASTAKASYSEGFGVAAAQAKVDTAVASDAEKAATLAATQERHDVARVSDVGTDFDARG